MIRERSERTVLRQLWLNYGIRLYSGRVVRMSVLGGALPTGGLLLIVEAMDKTEIRNDGYGGQA